MIYSPRITEDNVRRLYRLKQQTKIPMTVLANEAIDVYLNNKLNQQTNMEELKYDRRGDKLHRPADSRGRS